VRQHNKDGGGNGGGGGGGSVDLARYETQQRYRHHP
jgi:hypothetical protein